MTKSRAGCPQTRQRTIGEHVRVTDERLLSLAAAPERAAILLDVDGTLAPIVRVPEDARVPDETRAELERLVRRYSLVACLSGRTGQDAACVVGVAGIVYIGAHGLELDPQAKEWRNRLREFSAGVDWPVEDKGVTVSFHFRTAPDEAVARAYLQTVAERARAEGLRARFGRKVLELRPPVEADKGTAASQLVAGRSISRGLYAGDDTTDLDAFRGLRDSGLELAVCVAVASHETPSGLVAAADLVVPGTAGMLDLLRRL
jgi:trehalose 6-phosphate phosphatase